jgi:uncharacterized protein (TIGR00730 family)
LAKWTVENLSAFEETPPVVTTRRTLRRAPKPVDPELAALAARWAGAAGGADIVGDMLMSVKRIAESGLDRGELKILGAALRELRYAFKTFDPFKDVRKVSIFGSARTRPDAPEYRQALEFARRMAHAGYMVITGAGDGIMAAGNEGAGAAKSFGLNIHLPFEQASNRFIAGDPKLITFRYFFTRKLVFLKETHAIALFPGGFGTLDEGFETLTLIQTGKSPPLPFVLVDKPRGTYWKTWESYIEDHLLRRGWISEEDLGLYFVTDRVDQAVEEILKFYRVYHSSRYVKDCLVVRCRKELPDREVSHLAKGFRDMLIKDGIEKNHALPEEDEPHLAHLPRLVLRFNRRSFGRLRAFIDALNEL